MLSLSCFFQSDQICKSWWKGNRITWLNLIKWFVHFTALLHCILSYMLDSTKCSITNEGHFVMSSCFLPAPAYHTSFILIIKMPATHCFLMYEVEAAKEVSVWCVDIFFESGVCLYCSRLDFLIRYSCITFLPRVWTVDTVCWLCPDKCL